MKFRFLKSIAERQNKTTATQREQYIELVHKTAKAGDLSPADQTKIEQITTDLKIPVARIAEDIQTVRAYIDAKPLAAGLAAAKESHQKAHATLREYERETERIVAQRKDGHIRMIREDAACLDRINAATKSADLMARLAAENGDILGDMVERKPPPIAHLTGSELDLRERRDAEMENLHADDASEKEIKKVIHKHAALIDRHRSLVSAAGKNPCFQLSDANLDENNSNIGIEVDEYDWRPLKGQDEAEFDTLLRRLKATRAAVIERDRPRASERPTSEMVVL